MKNIQIPLVILGMVAVFSCSQPHSNKELVGKWKMNQIHIKQFTDQMGQMETQMSALKDSLAVAKDSASGARFQMQLDQVTRYMQGMQAQKDSGLKNTYWTFKDGGRLEGQEADHRQYDGYWEYNENTKMLKRYLPADSVKIDVKGDTMTLHFDSTNSIIFARQK